MGCQHLEELYELWWLGAVSEKASQDLGEHLTRGCPHCQERIRDAGEVVYLLGLAAKPLRPRPRLKSELLRQVSAQPST